MPIVRSRQQILRAGPLDNENGLIFWSRYGDGSAVDFSSYGNKGTLTGGPVLAPGPTARTPAMLFASASSQYVDHGNITTFNNQSQLTILAWINATTLSGGTTILGKSPNGAAGTNRILLATGFVGNGNVLFGLSDASNDFGYGNTTISTGIWYRLAAVFDGSLTGNANRLKLFFNAVQQTMTLGGTIPATTSNSNTASVFIGRENATQTNYFNGSIADVMVYNRALTPVELYADYNAAFSAFATVPDEWEMPILQAAAAGGRGLFLPPNLNGLGSGGSFFGDRIAA